MGYIANEGTAIPVASVVCRENRVRSARRFMWKEGGEDLSLLSAIAAEVTLAIAAADQAEARRLARQENTEGMVGAEIEVNIEEGRISDEK